MSPKKGKPIPAVEGFPRVSGDEPGGRLLCG